MNTKLNLQLLVLGWCTFVCCPAFAQGQLPANSLPHLEKRGAVTQLIVDGKPFLVLGGELAVRTPPKSRRFRLFSRD
jgi:hypothetical protein